MNNDIFPKYNVENLKDNLFIEIDNSAADLIEISLEGLSVTTGKKFIDQQNTQISLTFTNKEINFEGEIIHFNYIRELKRYHYNISVKFDDISTFMKWFTIITGIHKARFKC